jgi:triacylglycerol lipase
MSKAEDVEKGLMVMYAADMYKTFPTLITPPVDGRLSANWAVVGFLTGVDAILRPKQQLSLGAEVCYGVLARNLADPTKHVVAVRGTQGIVEWIEDAQFVSINHPGGAGRVEGGFWNIYASMKLKVNNGDAGRPAKDGIAAAVGVGGTLTVAGHSLGSALATYLAFDLADPELLGARVDACLFASPHPGNDAFVNAFDASLSGRYVLYNYFLDAVPRVPFGPDYAHLPGVTDLRPSDAEARIRFDLGCNHHIVCYCAMLDYAETDAAPKMAVDQTCVICIKGPSGVTGSL